MSGMQIKLYQTDNGPCPYRDDETWHNVSFRTSNIPADGYSSLLNQGFRRSGLSIYHPVCSGCQSCIPLRVDVQNFSQNKGQRRTWRKNKDIRVEHHPVGFYQDDFELYRRYQQDWHNVESPVEESEYFEFLVETPVPTVIIRYYLGNKLIGLGWLDCLPDLISSVYFVFDPEYLSRRLGVFSLLYEIEYTRFLDIRWLYLGYWVANSPKMNYKANFQPAQILHDSRWIPFNADKK
ncbi:MAG: arginyltransferase [SAR324 cluster bacterium]|nr:arginyltransferase [SAR324 cluster bacterium]MBL7035894.1 arginyltransferase [SAR324 cluster bacterium]